MFDMPPIYEHSAEMVRLCKRVEQPQACANLRLDSYQDQLRDTLVHEINVAVAAIGKVEISDSVSWPEDWWQAVRQRWAPRWWLRRHPVRLKTHQLKVHQFRAMCPHVAVPKNEKCLRFLASHDFAGKEAK